MSGVAARELVAGLVAGALPDPWVTYTGPPEVVSFPAAVVLPRAPYRRPGTFCAEIVNLTVTLLVARAAGIDGIDEIDEMLDVVRDAVAQDPTIVPTPESVAELGPMIAPGGTEAYGGSVDLEVYMSGGT